MAKKKSKTPETISDLIPDDKNFNRGNEYGESLIAKSFSKFGAGRGILVDRNNRIIAGNKSTQKFVEAGNEKIIVVETTGDTLVVTKRTDIDLDTPQGREMALADNASALKNISFDCELIEAEVGEAVLIEWGLGSDKKEVEGNFDDEGIAAKNQFGVIVICGNDEEQEKIFKELTNLGYSCKVVVT